MLQGTRHIQQINVAFENLFQKLLIDIKEIIRWRVHQDVDPNWLIIIQKTDMFT